MAIRTLIVDDEALARHRINRLLSEITSVEVVATADNGQQAIDSALKYQPDLVFMDIQMPVKSGLVAAKEIIEQLDRPPAIVFCTAFDQHAVDAFRLNAAAYLLKPVMIEDLQTAIQQAGALTQFQVSKLLEQKSIASTICIQHSNYIENILLGDILYFRSELKNVVAGLVGGAEVVVDYTLKDLENQFGGEFVRAHRNSLINKRQLIKLLRDQNGKDILKLSDSPLTFEVSRRNLLTVKKCFDSEQ